MSGHNISTNFFTIIIPTLYLNYPKEVLSEAFIFIKYRKSQQKDKCFTNTFGPEVLWMARNCHRKCQRPHGRNGRRGKDRTLRDRKMGLPLWLYPAVCDRIWKWKKRNVPCIICGNCDRIRLFCRETDGTKEEARTMQVITCGWEHI